MYIFEKFIFFERNILQVRNIYKYVTACENIEYTMSIWHIILFYQLFFVINSFSHILGFWWTITLQQDFSKNIVNIFWNVKEESILSTHVPTLQNIKGFDGRGSAQSLFHVYAMHVCIRCKKLVDFRKEAKKHGIPITRCREPAKKYFSNEKCRASLPNIKALIPYLSHAPL